MIHTSVNFTISALWEFPTFLYIFPTFSHSTLSKITLIFQALCGAQIMFHDILP